MFVSTGGRKSRELAKAILIALGANGLRYFLRILAGGMGDGVEITEEEFLKSRRASGRIVMASQIEEKFDMVMANFFEYELEIFKIAQKSVIYSTVGPDLEEIYVINRRAMNLLSSVRSYTDQSKRSSSDLLSEDKVIGDIFSREYDVSLEFRIAEALRNYSQHRNTPVHELVQVSEFECVGTGEERHRTWFEPRIHVQELRNDVAFKASVLEELVMMKGEQLHLTHIIRRYIEGIGKIHEAIRELVEPIVRLDYEVVQNLIQRTSVEIRPDARATGVVAEKEDGSVAEYCHISDRHWERRAFLVDKNSLIGRLSFRCASVEFPRNLSS